MTVVPGRQGSGLGSAMLALLKGEARRLGVERLHLANGYSGADRGSAPAPIAASREFTALCPASATYLVKAL